MKTAGHGEATFIFADMLVEPDVQVSIIFTIKELLKFLNRLYDITWFWAVYTYEKRKLFQTRLYKYNLFKKFNNSLISNIAYNLIFTTKFNDSSILITIISCNYFEFVVGERICW